MLRLKPRDAYLTCLLLAGIFLTGCLNSAAGDPSLTPVGVLTLTSSPGQTPAPPASAVSPLPDMQPEHTHTPQASEQLVPTAPSILQDPPILQPESFRLCSPLQSETISSLWEIVSDPYNPPPPGREERHHGVDFAYYRRGERSTIEGEVVQAILPGRVAAVIHDRLPYGNMLIIESEYASLPPELAQAVDLAPDESLYHLYAHLAEAPEFALGEQVSCGQPLGRVGTTGYYVVNPHLHLEIRAGPPGAVFTAMVFYDTRATQEEMEQYTRWRTGGEFRHFDPMRFFQAYLDLEALTGRDPADEP